MAVNHYHHNSGKILISQLYSKKEDEIIEFDVKIKEHPELDVKTDGSIIFPKNKKYKSSDDIHINGTITILEPTIVYKLIKTTYETIYIKRHYKQRYVGTIMSEDIFKSQFSHETYHTK